MSLLSFSKGGCAIRCGFKRIGTGDGRRETCGRGSGLGCCWAGRGADVTGVCLAGSGGTLLVVWLFVERDEVGACV